ncbi:MAG: type II toxin-antitoxin system YafQ family toxin [Acidobacteriaceae bacterium]|jgi:mRNA interferase YafQ
MLTTVSTNRFLKDVKLTLRRGKDLKKLEAVILLLANQSGLPANLRDHFLSGEWANHRECHIAPDWLLIYKIQADELFLVRTGTHSDLFAK